MKPGFSICHTAITMVSEPSIDFEKYRSRSRVTGKQREEIR
jgi:hypothetical protein